MTTTMIDNPFPREAVATHGKAIRYSARLRSMNDLHDELVTYLSSYVTPSRRYGAALGICGEHGSGKTHVLNWLAQRGSEITRSECAILYAKADSARMLDIYQHVIREVKRPRIIELLQRALVTIARAEVRAAKVMEPIDQRLDDVPSLNRLIEEGSLDRSRLDNLLQKRLEEVAPPDLVRTLIDCAGPSGEAAYHWLRGDEVNATAPLGLVHKFSSNAEGGAALDNDDTIALHGLTLIAALHELAEIPLVLMIDQLEVLLRAEGQRLETLSSLAKRAIEALSAASALVFIAGTEDGWSRLTRDVFPRFRGGTPYRVGSLNRDQCVLLIDAYTDRSTSYSKAAMERLLELSGGSPREILRISNRAFESHEGRLESVTADELLEHARQSSTIADRSRLALEMIDQIARGRFEHNDDIRFDDNLTVDRLIRTGSRPVAAIHLMRAADPTEEAVAARSLSDVGARIKKEWPGAVMIAVTVGYASKQVNDAIRALAKVIEFNEETFRSRIETELTLAVTRDAVQPADSSQLTKALDDFAKRIEKIEARRQDQEAAVEKRYADGEAKQRATEAADVGLRTRVEIRDQLLRLQDACRRGDIDTERGLMKALLVSNEVHLKDTVLDQLGGVYLDLLALAARQTAPFQKERLELLSEMRSHLNSPAMPTVLAEHPVKSAVYVGAATTLVMALLLGAFRMGYYGFLPALVLVTPQAVVVGLAFGLAWYFILYVWSTARRWRRRVAELEAAAASDWSGSTVVGFVANTALLIFGGLVSLFRHDLPIANNLGPFFMIGSASLIALHWKRPFTERERVNTRITSALITTAALATLVTFGMPDVFKRTESVNTDTAVVDTAMTDTAATTGTMSTSDTASLSTTGTMSTDTVSTSTTGTLPFSDTSSKKKH